MAAVTVIYWRDIPAQVVVKQGRRRARRELPQRFQQAIDRAAMRAKKITADAYLDDWRQIKSAADGDDLEVIAERLATQLDADYGPPRLEAIVRNHGLAPAAAAGIEEH